MVAMPKKNDQLLQHLQHEEKICNEVKIQLREEIYELKQKLQKQIKDCDTEKPLLQNETCAEGDSKLQDDITELEQKLQKQEDACFAEKTRLQTELTVLREKLAKTEENVQRDKALIAGLEGDNLFLQRGDRPESGDGDVVELQRLSAENYDLRYEIDERDAQIASLKDANDRAMEKSKEYHPYNDPDYHCKCCGRHTTSHGDAISTPVCVSVTDRWHPSAGDMTASMQDMRARLREMQEKYDKKHEQLKQCEAKRKHAVERAYQCIADRRKAEEARDEALNGTCAKKCEVLVKECADLKERLHALCEAIEINGEAVRKVAKDAWDGID